MVCLLFDVRAGRHMDWYEAFFQSTWFQQRVDYYCVGQVMGLLDSEVRLLELQSSLAEGCAGFNAIGGGSDAGKVS